MCGTAVRKAVSTARRPRSSATSPAGAPGLCGDEPGGGEPELRRGALPADGEERHVRDDALPRLQPQHGAARWSLADLEPIDRLAEAEGHGLLPHLVDTLVAH